MLHALSLDGTWELRWWDGQRGSKPEFSARAAVDPARAIPAIVPGEVHLDLARAGIIAEPTARLDSLAARWVEEMLWTWRRTVTVPAEALSGRTWLCFDCLDLGATIVLNGAEVGRHGNYFRPCRIEVTGRLVAGDNILAVTLDPGLFAVADKPSEGYGGSLDNRLHKRYWLRKPQCQFGWDWSPRLINVGISGPVRLEWSADPVRIDAFVPIAEMADDLASASVRARLVLEGLATQAVPARITIELPGLVAPVTVAVTVKPGLASYDVIVPVQNPALWWPVGHGAQPLHRITARVEAAGTVIGERAARIGFRHVRIRQDPHPAGGSVFILEVNHRPIFCKGGNLVPADIIFARIDRERYQGLIDRALESNSNLLRVWGGGLYEADAFYELCDERGILVWQEFIFACSRYPGHDGAFYAEVAAEAEHQVRRLAPHPSLVVWCGNNENEMGAWSWGFDRGTSLPDHAIYHHLLPKVLQREDPGRYYQPSSPMSPLSGREDPNADDRGDQHPWTIGFGDSDFRKYRAMTCRFPNEGGILGPNSLPTVRECLPPGEDRTWSFAWQQHDNAIAGWEDPCPTDGMLTQWLGRDIRAMTIPEYVHLGGLVQAEGLREYIDNFRRRMFDSAAAVFWMFNDTWPAVRSWTIVDYRLRRTPAFHPVRRAFAPVSVVLVEDGDAIRVIGVNDGPEPVRARLRHGLFAIAGGYPLDRSQEAVLAANAATELARFPRSAWTDPRSQIAFAVLERDGAVLARNKLILPLYKELAWVPAKPTVRLDGGRAVFTSPVFAWGVCLDLDGERQLADNMFDIFPDQSYALPWEGAPPRILAVGNLSA